MAYESISKIERKCIFRETFRSEADVRRNRGVPLGITFSKGRGIWTGANDQLITYPASFANFQKTDVFSVRVKMKLSSTQSSHVAILFKMNSVFTLGWATGVVISGTIGIMRFYTNADNKSGTTGKVNFDNAFYEMVWVYNDAGTYKVKFYVNGVYDTESVDITAMSKTNNPLLVCDDITGFGDYTGEMELIEIYNYALNVNEVDRLYNKRRFKNFNIAHAENLSAKLNVSACINSGASPYDTFTAVGLDGFDVISDGVTLAVAGTADEIPVVAGKTYKVTCDITVNSGNNFNDCRLSAALSSTALSNAEVPVAGSNIMYFLAVATGTGTLQFYHANLSAGNVSVRNLVVKQVASLTTSKIIDVSAQSGTIIDKVGNTLTLTGMTVKKHGQVRAMYFNGSTSKVDCGAPNTLVGDKTFIAWIKPKSYGEGSLGRIFDNGKLMMAIQTSTRSIRFSSDGWGSNKYSAALSVFLNKWQIIVVTRTSTGIANIYKNGVLSGTANESSGTPMAGTTNLIIGNNIGATNTFDGFINNIRIVDRLLTSEEISQLYTVEKQKYGL